MSFSGRLCIFIFALLVAFSVHAKDKVPSKEIRVVTFPIPLWVESPTKGPFVDLVREIAQRNQLKLSVDVLPVGKAQMDFAAGKYHVFFPLNTQSKPLSTVRSDTFYTKKDFIFHRKGTSYSSIKSIEGKRVGLTFRFLYSRDLLDNKNILFEYAEDDFVNMRKLGEGRLDAFVVEEVSGMRALEQSGFDNIQYDKDHPLVSNDVAFGFPDNKEGRALSKIFSQTLRKLKEDGSLTRILAQREKTSPK